MAPNAWSERDERQYQAIRDQLRSRDVQRDRAQEIAARTVNKQRQQEGRTVQRGSRATGNPHVPLDRRRKRELYNRARELGIHGRSKMSKHELLTAIRARNA